MAAPPAPAGGSLPRIIVADAGGPVLAFIHGGYWQMRAKETFSFVAAGPLAHGINVALLGYTLAPEKRLEGIVAEVCESVRWLATQLPRYGGDPSRLVVSGWSAGGHLAVMSLREPAVRGALAISGIYYLEPIRLCYLNERLRLDADEAHRNSPLLNLPRDSAPLVLAYGGGELPELARQPDEFPAAWNRAELPGRRRGRAPVPKSRNARAARRGGQRGAAGRSRARAAAEPALQAKPWARTPREDLLGDDLERRATRWVALCYTNAPSHSSSRKCCQGRMRIPSTVRARGSRETTT